MCINKNAELLPYYEKAKELLNYNPETGELTWNKTVSSRAVKGSVAGSDKGNGYKRIKINNKSILAHRFVWFIHHGELPHIIDHIDGNPSNNRIENLRQCSQSENGINRTKQKNNKSGFKGVSRVTKRNKWKAKIGHKGKAIHLGLFDCPKEASRAYEAKARELFGEFYNS